MRPMTRLLAIFAIVFLTVQPVLACPLMVGDTVNMAAVAEGDTPCHQMIADNSLRTPSEDHHSGECPAGDDCAPMLLQAQSDANPPVLTTAPDLVFAAILADPPVNFPPERQTFKTGPPPAPDLPLFTPVTLKQRFLN